VQPCDVALAGSFTLTVPLVAARYSQGTLPTSPNGRLLSKILFSKGYAMNFDFHRALSLALISAVLCAITNVGNCAQVTVGEVAPFSGPAASQGRAYRAGLQLYFNSINKAGGLNGNTFHLVSSDDGGRPEDTVAQTASMLQENRPIVLTGFFGNRNLRELSASGLLRVNRIALVGYRTWETAPADPNMFNIRAGVREEVLKIAQHLGTIGISRVALFYEEGAGAPQLLALMEEVTQKTQLRVRHKAAYAEGGLRISAAVESLLSAAPQAIIMVCSGSAAAAFIEQYKSMGGKAQLFATSSADIEQLSKRLADEQMQGIAIAQVTPNPYKIALRVTREFHDLVEREKNLEVPVSYPMLEGYLSAKLIVEAARRQGAHPTQEGTLAALSSLSADLGGYLVDFAPERRNGSSLVDLSIVSSSGRIRQ
jgi:branched-chain amino acid transport system substrate-binding protein